MPSLIKIHLSEESAWTGLLYKVEVDGAAVCFEGVGPYEGRFPRDISLRPGSLSRMMSAIGFLGVADWKNEYSPEDAGSTVDDGGSWNFKVEDDGKSIETGGTNAYPSYESALITSLHEERFGLLREAVFDILHFNVSYGSFPKNRR